jgi:folate-dependent phosphoribosylglycinamide formyltransferase PurN
MRIVLLAVNDEFAGEMQRFLYQAHPDWIRGLVTSSSMLYKQSNFKAVLTILRKSGLIFLADSIHIKMVRYSVDKRKEFLPSQLAKRHGVEEFKCSDINDPRSLAKLRSWNPDLIISTNFSHYIGKTVRESTARYGCWNLHKSLLPQYRGMSPSFHALLEGALKVGATLHVVAKGFDTGDVLAQAEVPVTKADSVYSLNRRTSRAGGKLLASFLETFDPRSTKAIPQPEGAWKNYTFPTRPELKAFRRQGLRFYKPYNDED